MIDYKSWNLKSLGNYIILGIVVLAIIVLFMTIVVPLLGHVSTVFTTVTLTDTLLFLMLLRLFSK